MYLAFVILSTFVALSKAQLGKEVQGKRAENNQNLADLIFTDDLLFAFNAWSLLHCARACRSTHRCLSFTFTRDTSSSTSCRGHTSVMSPGRASQPSPSTNAFNFGNWLYDSCSGNHDCPAENSECFAGKCLSTPGFYFSHSKYTCAAACDQGDLSTDFVYYPNSRIRLHNLYEDNRPLPDCKALCLGTYAVQCRTIDYRFTDGRCIIATVTALDVPTSWNIGIWDHDHYQITCA